MNKVIATGAEAVLLLTNFSGQKAVCKRRVEKAYRIPEIDVVLREERTKKEAKILEKVGKAGIRCPTVFKVDLEKKEIFLSFVEGKLLREVDSVGKNTLEKIGSDLAAMHSIGVVHGDCTSSNIMVSRGKVAWIDFGLASITHSVEEQATDLLLLKKSLKEKQFKLVKKAYLQKGRKAMEVFGRLEQIEKRGRYVVRAMVA